LQAIDSALQSIKEGRSQLVLAGGTEAMSRAPLLFDASFAQWLGRMRKSKGAGDKVKMMAQLRPQLFKPVIALLKALTDPVVNLNMGQTAEELAFRYHITREAMDEFALMSQQRTLQAQKSGELSEISPLYARDGSVYEQDDGVRPDISLEKLNKLKPAFEKFGMVTAGNSSQITDGAAFVILASEQAVQRFHLPVLAKIVDVAWAGLDPTIMGLGPVHAVEPILKRQELTLNEIDHFEINEAFAGQVLACLRVFEEKGMGKVDLARLNPQGGAIAMGHPVGASGARLALHSAKMLQTKQLKRALVSLCIGGGQGGAMLLERGEG
jgi:acetyl-CoA C-acetyltransferase